MITLSFSKSILEKLYENLLIAQKLGNIRLYRLARAFIWFAEDVGLKEMAKRMGVCVKTIVTWVQTFMYKLDAQIFFCDLKIYKIIPKI